MEIETIMVPKELEPTFNRILDLFRDRSDLYDTSSPFGAVEESARNNNMTSSEWSLCMATYKMSRMRQLRINMTSCENSHIRGTLETKLVDEALDAIVYLIAFLHFKGFSI